MPKALTITGFVVASLILILFGLDLATSWPFQKASMAMDICFLLCAGILGYLSWNTLRDLR
jgi:hypothetical protein